MLESLSIEWNQLTRSMRDINCRPNQSESRRHRIDTESEECPCASGLEDARCHDLDESQGMAWALHAHLNSR